MNPMFNEQLQLPLSFWDRVKKTLSCLYFLKPNQSQSVEGGNLLCSEVVVVVLVVLRGDRDFENVNTQIGGEANYEILSLWHA